MPRYPFCVLLQKLTRSHSGNLQNLALCIQNGRNGSYWKLLLVCVCMYVQFCIPDFLAFPHAAWSLMHQWWQWHSKFDLKRTSTGAEVYFHTDFLALSTNGMLLNHSNYSNYSAIPDWYMFLLHRAQPVVSIDTKEQILWSSPRDAKMMLNQMKRLCEYYLMPYSMPMVRTSPL